MRWFAVLVAWVVTGCASDRFEPTVTPRPDRVGGGMPEPSELVWLTPPPAQGKAMLLELGTSDCASCQRLRGSMAEWAETYGERGVTLAHVLDGRTESSVESLRGDAASGCLMALDSEGRWFEFFEVSATPTYVAVDPRGEVQWVQPTAREGWIEEWLEELAHLAQREG